MQWLVLLALVVIAAPIVLSIIALIVASEARREMRRLRVRLRKPERDGGLERDASLSTEADALHAVASPIPAQRTDPSHGESESDARVELEPAPPRDLEPPVEDLEVPEAIAVATAGDEPEDLARHGTRDAPRPRRSFEELIGAKAFAWMGAIALALAAVFLVKYSHEHGIISPLLRAILAALFGVALIGGSEWVARRVAGIAQAMAAAGVAALYGATLAAVHLYELIEPVPGTLCMAAVTGAAVLLSLRRGPFVALLGLVGGFLTPVLIGSEDPNLRPLLSYLFLLQVGLVAVTRRRGWWVLSALTLLGGFGWVSLLLIFQFKPIDGPWLGLFLLGSVASFVLAAPRGQESETVQRALRFVTGAAAASGLLLMALLVGVADFTLVQWSYMGILGAGCLVLGRLDPRYHWLPWLGAGSAVVLLAVWALPFNRTQTAPDTFTLFLNLSIAFGLLHAGGAYVALWGARRPAMWATQSVAAALALLFVAYLGHDSRELEWPWAGATAGLAGLFAVGAFPVLKRRSTLPQGNATLAALLVGCAALLAAAVPMLLAEERWTLGWALLVPAVVFIERRLTVPALGKIATALALGVFARLALNPAVAGYDIGTTPILNGLLHSYGIPLVAFLVAAQLYRRDHAAGDDLRPVEDAVPTVLLLELGAIGLWLALITLEVRHLFHGSELLKLDFPLREVATHACSWLGSALGMHALARQWPRRALTIAGGAVGIASVAGTVIGIGLVANPLWVRTEVGATAVFNELWLTYALPTLLVLALAASWRRNGNDVLARCGGITGLALVLLFVTLQVRQGFQGTDLHHARGMISWELYTYSLAGIVFGLLLMAIGILRHGVVTRWASLVVLLVVTAKVFLYDVSELGDLYRVLSFLCLGAALMGLGYVYQRYVFGGARGEPAAG